MIEAKSGFYHFHMNEIKNARATDQSKLWG